MKARILAVSLMLLCTLCSWAEARVLNIYTSNQYYRSIDDGQSFQIQTSPCGTAEAEAAQFFETESSLFFFWQEDNSLKLARSYGHNLTWSEPHTVIESEGIENPKLIYESDTIHIIFEQAGSIKYISSHDMGSSFSMPVLLNQSNPAILAADLISTDKELIVAFASYDGFKQNIYTVTSANNGLSWSQPKNLEYELNDLQEIILTDQDVSYIDKNQSGDYTLFTGATPLLTESRMISSLEAIETGYGSHLIKYNLHQNSGVLEPYFISTISPLPRKFAEFLPTDEKYIEAYFEENVLHALFESNYGIKKYQYDKSIFEEYLPGQEIYQLNKDAPRIRISQPQATNWFMSASTILIEADVEDPQKDLFEDIPITITLDDVVLDHFVYYLPEEEKLAGFLPLPSDLENTEHTLVIEMSDAAGNVGSSTFSIQIDSVAPTVSKLLKNGVVISGQKRVKVPLEDNRSGIDLLTSVVKLRDSSSKEVKGNLIEADDGIYFVPDIPLKIASYLFELSPKDKAGNIGATEFIKVKVTEDYISANSPSTFSVNTVSLEYGPNPFNPAIDRDYVIKYVLSSAMQAKLYIFDLYGSVILMRDLGTARKQSVVWDGKNHFGESVANGIYPFVLLSEGTSREVKRGRIIVLR